MSEQPTEDAPDADVEGAGPPDPTGDVLVPPPGSPERLRHQHIGEVLLTDDGRITETPEAKTIAIRALAERMRSSTPELVLASLGLVVGTDMADHLGDGRYVLVPHNARYPSMGAEVHHVDELDPADPGQAPDRVVRMDAPRADALVRMIAVSELMGSWAFGSNNNVRVLALQQAAREEFDLANVLEWHLDAKTRAAVDLELDYNRGALRDFLRTQYEMTQEVLAARGITELISYRALTWPGGTTQPEWAVANVGETLEARQRPLASWSADRRIVSDWLEQRGGSGVIFAARKPARDILSLPLTGMGYLAQKEWVALPGDSLVVLDGAFSDQATDVSVEQTAASSVSLGAPALDSTADDLTEGPAEAPLAAGDRRWPFATTEQLDPADPLDSRITRILDGVEQPPDWWPKDDSGYAITGRDLDFLGINPVQVKWMLTGEAPMGMTPELYRQFGTEMVQALERDGIDPSEVDIRLKGTGAGLFSGIHKTLPREDDLAGNPAAAQRLREWLGAEGNRPLRRPYDAMWRLGLEAEPSDFDLDINSTAIVRAARVYWQANNPDRYPGDFMGGHGYLDKQTALATLPALAEWAGRWEARLGRPLSLGVFESSGPFNATVLGRDLSSHFKDTDWIIHRPDTPEAWNTPKSQITDWPAFMRISNHLRNLGIPERDALPVWHNYAQLPTDRAKDMFAEQVLVTGLRLPWIARAVDEPEPARLWSDEKSAAFLRTQLALRRELGAAWTGRLDEILAAAEPLMSGRARAAATSMVEAADAASLAAEGFRGTSSKGSAASEQHDQQGPGRQQRSGPQRRRDQEMDR